VIQANGVLPIYQTLVCVWITCGWWLLPNLHFTNSCHEVQTVLGNTKQVPLYEQNCKMVLCI